MMDERITETDFTIQTKRTLRPMKTFEKTKWICGGAADLTVYTGGFQALLVWGSLNVNKIDDAP
jgi:hypothetical protein